MIGSVKDDGKRGRTSRYPAPDRREWQFIEHVDGRYQWRHVDSRGQVLSESPSTFLFLLSCMKDAVRHGYIDEVDHAHA